MMMNHECKILHEIDFSQDYESDFFLCLPDIRHSTVEAASEINDLLLSGINKHDRQS